MAPLGPATSPGTVPGPFLPVSLILAFVLLCKLHEKSCFLDDLKYFFLILRDSIRDIKQKY